MLRTVQVACTLPKARLIRSMQKVGVSTRICLSSTIVAIASRSSGFPRKSVRADRRRDWTGQRPCTPIAGMPPTGLLQSLQDGQSLPRLGLDVNYPHKRKHFRTTIWKSTGIRLERWHVAPCSCARTPPGRDTVAFQPAHAAQVSSPGSTVVLGTVPHVTTAGIWSLRMVSEHLHRQEERRLWRSTWAKSIRLP